MITTNLRMEEADWLQIKAMAGELGMSFNEYVNYLIRQVSTKKQLGKMENYKDASIWEELPGLAKIKNRPGKFNKDDKIIYA